MFVTHLSLADFRSWPFAELEFGPGVTTLTGRNGQGKTNLVEAVEYLATLGSHRVASDAPLIRFGSPRALVRARVQAGLDDPRTLALEVEINAGKANRASLNRGPLKRPRDLLGALRKYHCMEFELLAKVLTPAEIIRSATVVGAELCQLKGEVGVIAAGAHADLIVVDGNPLDDITLLMDDGAHMPMIMRAGRFVKH